MPFPLCSSSEDRVVWASSPISSFDSKSVHSVAVGISNCNPPFTRSWYGLGGTLLLEDLLPLYGLETLAPHKQNSI